MDVSSHTVGQLSPLQLEEKGARKSDNESLYGLMLALNWERLEKSKRREASVARKDNPYQLLMDGLLDTKN